MEKYLFILGSNWRLSLAEIETYLIQSDFLGRITDYSTNVAIVEFEHSPMNLDTIDYLLGRMGTIQKIAKMLDFIDHKTFLDAFPTDIEENRAAIYSGRRYIDNTLKDVAYSVFPKPKDQKCFIANSIYPENFNDEYYQVLIKYFLQYVNKFFNTHLKEKGAKSAIYYKYPQENIDSGQLNPIFPHHFLAYKLYEPNRAEIVYCFTEDGLYIGHTLTVADANFQKQLDEERPQKEFRESIPPKFAKALISFLNLPNPLIHRRILDPFCGTGTILQFALVQGIQVYGLDINKDQIHSTSENIKFTQKLYEESESIPDLTTHFIQGDIQHADKYFKPNFFDGIVSEPFILPFFKDHPEFTDVEPIVDEKVIPLYNELFKKALILLKPGARLALVSPIIHTKEKTRITIPIKEMAEVIGIKPILLLDLRRLPEKQNKSLIIDKTQTFSIYDMGSRHITREFFVFQKPKE